MSGTYVCGFMSAINLLFKQCFPGLLDAAFYLLFLASFTYFVLRRFSRYSTFDIRRNGPVTKTIGWVLSGVGGVLVFGVLAMYRRNLVFNTQLQRENPQERHTRHPPSCSNAPPQSGQAPIMAGMSVVLIWV
jgi:hypothetical protein